MYVIAGCAADRAAFESNKYGQGLLTYALLEGMKGSALNEMSNVDVSNLLAYARERVPELAVDLNLNQTPQSLSSKCEPFDLGILYMEDQKKIELNQPRKLYIKSHLVNKNIFRDNLKLSKMLNNELRELAVGHSEMRYLNIDRLADKCCQITGGYENNEQGLSLSMTTICEGIETEYQIEAKNKEELIDKIIQTLNLE